MPKTVRTFNNFWRHSHPFVRREIFHSFRSDLDVFYSFFLMNFWRHLCHLFSPSCFASYSFNLLRFTSSKVAFSLLCKSYAVDEILQNVIRAMFWPASFFHHVHIVVSWKTRLHFISSEMQNQFLTRENFPVSGCRERQTAFRRYIIRLVIHRMLSTTFDEIEWTAIR